MTHNEDQWITDVKPPEKCACTRLVVDTLDETLDCPWVHDGSI